MDVKRISYILAIAEEENLHKAAEKLYISQSSLSQYLKKIEEDLGTPLFIRTPKKLILTPAGILYIETAEKIINLKNTLYADIKDLSNVGHFTLGATSQWGVNLLSNVLPLFRKQFPYIMIELKENYTVSMKKKINAHEMDLCLTTTLPTDTFSFNSILLGEEELLFAVSKKESTTFLDNLYDITDILKCFSNYPLVLTQKNSTTSILIEEYFKKTNYKPKLFGYMDSIVSVNNLVASGTAVSFVPKSCCTHSGVNYYKITPSLRRLHLLLHNPNIEHNDATKYLIKLIKRYYAQ